MNSFKSTGLDRCLGLQWTIEIPKVDLRRVCSFAVTRPGNCEIGIGQGE